MAAQFTKQASHSMAAVMLMLAGVTLALKKGELLDMSYDMEEIIPYFPGQGSWELTVRQRGPAGDLPWLEYNSFAAPEHGGTHMDAPIHFAEGKFYIHEIPLSKLVAPAIRVDITEQAKADRDYALTVKDLQDWEEANGRIPDDSVLFLYSGWGAYYPDRLAFYGSSNNESYVDDQGNSLLHFPGIGPEAASWLLANRRIVGVGVDTPSLDAGQSANFMTHQILLGANIYGLELVANLDKLPNTGAKVYALPMKIKYGSGSPTRVVAMLDEVSTSGASTPSAIFTMIGTLVGLGLIMLF